MGYLTNKKVADIKKGIRNREDYWDLSTGVDNLVQASTVVVETYYTSGKNLQNVGFTLGLDTDHVPLFLDRAKKYLQKEAVLGEFTDTIKQLAKINGDSLEETAEELLIDLYESRKRIEEMQGGFDKAGKGGDTLSLYGMYEDAVLILAGVDTNKVDEHKYTDEPVLDPHVEQNTTEEDESTVVDQYPELYKLGKALLETPEKAVGAFFCLSVTTNVLLLTYGVGKVAKYMVKGTQKVFKLGKYKPLNPLQHPQEESGVNYFWEAGDEDSTKVIPLDLTNSITTRDY